MTISMRNNRPCEQSDRPYRLAVPPFLNTRPLIHGVESRTVFSRRLEVIPAPPSQLKRLLLEGRADVALLPAIDYAEMGAEWAAIPNLAIASEAEVLTVRVFSTRPPETITELAVDPDSHTSVALARVLWREVFGQELATVPLCGTDADSLAGHEAVLLIGDKVMGQLGRWPIEIDLGQYWHELTGGPFVYAFWTAWYGHGAGHGRAADLDALGGDPAKARDAAEGSLTPLRPERGCSSALPDWRSQLIALGGVLQDVTDSNRHRLTEIAERYGPEHGFDNDTAVRYLSEHLSFTMGPAEHLAIQRFYEKAWAAEAVTAFRLPHLVPVGEKQDGRWCELVYDREKWPIQSR